MKHGTRAAILLFLSFTYPSLGTDAHEEAAEPLSDRTLLAIPSGAAQAKAPVREFRASEIKVYPVPGRAIFGAQRVGLESAGTFADDGAPVLGHQDVLRVGCPSTGANQGYPCGSVLTLFARQGELFGFSLWDYDDEGARPNESRFLRLGTIDGEGNVTFTPAPAGSLRGYRQTDGRTGRIQTQLFLTQP